MKAELHLEGMGLIGSLIAWQLRARNIPFTWDDTENKVNAWQACTGCCYPGGSFIDQYCYAQWGNWLGQDGKKDVKAHSVIYPDECFEACQYWVDRVHESLPHGLKANVTYMETLRRVLGQPSYHVNAQALVRMSRELFIGHRTQEAPKGSQVVVAHGFSHRLERYIWGWTRLVEIQSKLPKSPMRPCFYLRKNRFQFAYAYPVPGMKWWYAGSSLISQRHPARLEIAKKYEGWEQRFNELAGSRAKVVTRGPMIEGWRPATNQALSEGEGAGAKTRNTEGQDWLTEKGGRIYVPPITTGGFRQFPELWRQLEKRLAL